MMSWRELILQNVHRAEARAPRWRRRGPFKGQLQTKCTRRRSESVALLEMITPSTVARPRRVCWALPAHQHKLVFHRPRDSRSAFFKMRTAGNRKHDLCWPRLLVMKSPAGKMGIASRRERRSSRKCSPHTTPRCVIGATAGRDDTLKVRIFNG